MTESQAKAALVGLPITKAQLQALFDLVNAGIDATVTATPMWWDDLAWRVARPLVLKAEQRIVDQIGT